jgi:DNA-3-methyladenine glycosylase
MTPDSWQFNEVLKSAASEVAPRLLGCILERQIDGKIVRVKIVETEAYDQTDVASHSYKGKTQRTEVMFGPAGHLYVYFTYGMHYCCNIVVGEEGYGAAVLIRAVEPIDNIEIIEKRRGKAGVEATNGPAKLCQALNIKKALNGHNLSAGELQLIIKPPISPDLITQTTRVGISQGKDVRWRFYITGNQYVSRQ